MKIGYWSLLLILIAFRPLSLQAETMRDILIRHEKGYEDFRDNGAQGNEKNNYSGGYFWQVDANSSLHNELYMWAKRAGWTLVWDSQYEYVTRAQADFSGDFVAAVQRLFSTLGHLSPVLYVTIYTKNKVLTVSNHPAT